MAKLNFDIPIQLFAAQLGLEIRDVVEKVAFDSHSKISKRTPVDTGRARASWMVTEGAPSDAVAEEGSHSKAVKAPDIQITGERVVYITNNLPYIEELENGSSKQAPAGMVAISLREVEAEIEQFVKGMLNRR